MAEGKGGEMNENLGQKTLRKEAALWKSLKTLLDATPVNKCHK
jgi:hypothetical protein